MAPPYHYEYMVEVGPSAQGKVIYTPSYPSDTVPTWTETFPVTGEQLDALYSLMLEKKVFSSVWIENHDGPVGGPQEWADITANGREIRLPTYLPEPGASNLSYVYSAIKACVPQAVWDKLEAQRTEYNEGRQRTPTP